MRFLGKLLMLARLTHDHFSDPDWIYERKLDGERCLAFRKDKKVRLKSRNRKSLNHTYPDIAEAVLDSGSDDVILDSEVVAFSGGITSFQRLQQRMQIENPEEARESKVAVYYYVFDILHLEGRDTTGLPLRSRKSLLKLLLPSGDPLRFLPHRNSRGEAYLEEACRKGWEGLIAKKADSPYRHSRSGDWLKFKCVKRQELVIGGYTDPRGERKGLGALLVGYYREGDLYYAGKVGTGYDESTLERLSKRLRSLERKTSPFEDSRGGAKGVHWVTPELVGEFGFTEWTSGGKLRHPRFLGLRRDKDPREVIREEPGER
jgi:DNA ligase D-like protein (predicted ligase)